VYNFDHHCQWLNNCVGSSNYRSFLTFLGVSILLISVHLASCIYVITLYFGSYPSFQANLTTNFNVTSNTSPFLGITWALAVLDLAILIFVAQLLLFHMYLVYTKQTTFQYITSKIPKKRSREDLESN
jgi:palmitoyltransferase